jgi:hypothetical protein
LLDDSSAGTVLDRIDDYSAYMGIDERVIRQTGTEWKQIISQLGYTPEHALEIGAGLARSCWGSSRRGLSNV